MLPMIVKHTSDIEYLYCGETVKVFQKSGAPFCVGLIIIFLEIE